MSVGTIFIPIIAVVLWTVATIHEKRFLNTSKISSKNHISGVFFWMSVLGLPLAVLSGEIIRPNDVLNLNTLFLLVALIIMGVFRNIVTITGFRGESLIKFDLAMTFEPVAKIFFAALLIPGERDLRILLVASLATAALAFGHIHHRHLSFSRKEKLIFIGLFFAAIEAVLIKFLLDIFSPALLYTIRASLLAIVFIALFGFSIKQLSSSINWGIFQIAALSFVIVLLYLYSYQLLGVTVTSLISLLYPVLLYLAAIIFFKERQPIRMAFAGSVIIACVAYTLIYIA